MKSLRVSFLTIASTILIIFLSGCISQYGGTANTQTNNQQPNSIDISNFAFTPGELKLKVGDTVTWTNKDSVGHTVTSDSGTELDSSLLSQSDTYQHTFNQAGTFDYHCTTHPYMKGKIIVE